MNLLYAEVSPQMLTDYLLIALGSGALIGASFCGVLALFRIKRLKRQLVTLQSENQRFSLLGYHAVRTENIITYCDEMEKIIPHLLLTKAFFLEHGHKIGISDELDRHKQIFENAQVTLSSVMRLSGGKK